MTTYFYLCSQLAYDLKEKHLIFIIRCKSVFMSTVYYQHAGLILANNCPISLDSNDTNWKKEDNTCNETDLGEIAQSCGKYPIYHSCNGYPTVVGIGMIKLKRVKFVNTTSRPFLSTRHAGQISN